MLRLRMARCGRIPRGGLIVVLLATVSACGGGGGPRRSGNADLAALEVNAGELAPPFSAEQADYSVAVDFDTDEIELTLSAAHAGAGVSVDGTPVSGGSVTVPLERGLNPVPIVVTAENGTTRTYTVDVTRDPGSDNANLSSLNISYGAFSEAFSPDRTGYTSHVGFLVNSVTISFDVEDAAAGASLDGVPITLAASSYSLPLFLSEGPNAVEIQVTAQDGIATKTYVVTVHRENADAFAQKAYIKASNSDAGDRFGGGVALSGDTLAIAARDEDSAATGIDGEQGDDSESAAGAVYVFQRDTAGAWHQQAYLKASNTEADDRFGWALALAGDTLIATAPGEDSAAAGIGGDSGNDDAPDAGAAYVFARNASGDWSQRAYLKASNARAGAMFGQSVAVHGDTIVVGSPAESSAATGVGGDGDDTSAPGAGAVYVFERDAKDLWSQQAYVKASNAGAGDGFGASVAIEDETFAVGATGEASAASGVDADPQDDTAPGAGAAYVFTRNEAGSWTEQSYIKASNPSPSSWFGASVDLWGDSLAVGAALESSTAPSSGAVYVFIRGDAGTWSEQAFIKESVPKDSNFFGARVSLSRDMLAIGAPLDDSLGRGTDAARSSTAMPGVDAGAVYLYARDAAGEWSEAMYVKASNAGAGDNFGVLALSGETLAVGAFGESSGAAGINGDQSSDGAFESGAVYVLGRGAGSDNALLSELAVVGGRLDQPFDDGRGVYTTAVGFLATAVELAARPQDGSAVVTANGIRIDPAGQVGGLFAGDNTVDIAVGAQDGETDEHYSLTVTRRGLDTLAQRAYIKAADPEREDAFGASFAMWGDTLAVGAPGEDSGTGEGLDEFDNGVENSGGVHVFVRDAAGQWSQQAYLKASNADEHDAFGASVSLYGDTLVVGAPGEAGAAGAGEDDDSAAGAGAVYVFGRDESGDWEQRAYLKASNAEAADAFGHHVSLDGDMLAVGAPAEDGGMAGIGVEDGDNGADSAGAVYVFARDGTGQWSQQAYVKASNANAVDYFGSRVDMNGATLAVGAPSEGSGSSGVNGEQNDFTKDSSGAVYIFVRTGSVWHQQAYVKASNPDAFDSFGRSLSLDGDLLAVGAPRERSAATGIDGDQTDNTADSIGAVYVFARDDEDVWSQQAYIKASNAAAGDAFGHTVTLRGGTLVVGAPGESGSSTGINGNEADDGSPGAGAAYLFTRNPAGAWSQQAYVKASTADDGDRFGAGVLVSGDTAMIWAEGEAGGIGGIDGSQTDNREAQAGAVYAFR